MRPVRIDLRAVRLALRQWTLRRWLIAAASAVAVGVLIGLATVLIPNPVFTRDIPPVWWNHPVLVLMSILTGLLTATFVRDRPVQSGSAAGDSAAGAGGGPAGDPADAGSQTERGGRMGVVGTVLAWFAVGCPVCNKIALLALGYSGALTFFAPLQPVLAILAVLLTGYALLQRLQGEVACPMPRRATAAPSAPDAATTGEVR